MDELNEYLEPLLTPKELSKWLNVKLSTIYNWSHKGYIPTVDIGGKIKGPLRFARVEIAHWLKRKMKPGRSTQYPTINDLDNS